MSEDVSELEELLKKVKLID